MKRVPPREAEPETHDFSYVLRLRGCRLELRFLPHHRSGSTVAPKIERVNNSLHCFSLLPATASILRKKPR